MSTHSEPITSTAALALLEAASGYHLRPTGEGTLAVQLPSDWLLTIEACLPTEPGGPAWLLYVLEPPPPTGRGR